MHGYIGVDPGGSGAIAFWVPETRSLVIQDLPSLVLKRGKKNVTHVDVLALTSVLTQSFGKLHAEGARVALAIIEEIGMRQGQAMGSVMTTGINWGRVEALLKIAPAPLETVTASTWKRDMGCKVASGASDKAIKDAARHRASQLLPQYEALWRRAKDHNRAEAVLIALYAERIHKQRMAVK